MEFSSPLSRLLGVEGRKSSLAAQYVLYALLATLVVLSVGASVSLTGMVNLSQQQWKLVMYSLGIANNALLCSTQVTVECVCHAELPPYLYEARNE